MKYADAGVNIAVADDAKQRIRHLASRTFTPAVLGGIGGFGALFALDGRRWKEPVLVSSADGVGTKLKIAMAMGVHSTVGGDLVNHCVNDILVQGAEPLFFLDYLAMGKLEPNVVEQLVDGMSRACRKAGCALIGGETAEMPGFYRGGAQENLEWESSKAWRHVAGLTVHRAAHEWIFAGAQTRVRSGETQTGNVCGRGGQ